MHDEHQFLAELDRIIERSKNPPWWDVFAHLANHNLRAQKVYLEPAGSSVRRWWHIRLALRVLIAMGLYVLGYVLWVEDVPLWAVPAMICIPLFAWFWALMPIFVAQAYRNGYWDAQRAHGPSTLTIDFGYTSEPRQEE